MVGSGRAMGFVISLPDTHIVYSLLRQAPGPSPWWCRDPIASALGPLVWKKLDQPPGFNALMDSEGRPRLALPMYIWFQVLGEGWMLLWNRQRSVGQIVPSPILGSVEIQDSRGSLFVIQASDGTIRFD
jgi:hypothetical protein